MVIVMTVVVVMTSKTGRTHFWLKIICRALELIFCVPIEKRVRLIDVDS